MEFQQYLGFLAFLAIFTLGFSLLIFLAILAPYWASSYLFMNSFFFTFYGLCDKLESTISNYITIESY